METGYTNQAETLLNFKSTLYAKYQFGLFSIVHPQLSTELGEPRRCCLFTAKSILNNTPPIQIPLLDIEPIADLKDADMQYLIASIEKQDPAFLWYLLRSFSTLLSNACLDKILTHSEKLRSYLNTRMMPESYHRYLLSFTSLDNNYISSNSILSSSIKELLVSMIEYTPITCLRADRPDILQILLKHGADPYVSLRFDESQYKAFLPEHFGLPAGKNIYRLRRAMLDESSKISANTKAGFSIIRWTGDNADRTIAHGLTETPEFFMTKSLSQARNWEGFHKNISTGYILSLIYFSAVFSALPVYLNFNLSNCSSNSPPLS